MQVNVKCICCAKRSGTNAVQCILYNAVVQHETHTCLCQPGITHSTDASCRCGWLASYHGDANAGVRVGVLFDSAEGLQLLADEAVKAGLGAAHGHGGSSSAPPRQLDVLVEVNVGQDRCGLRRICISGYRRVSTDHSSLAACSAWWRWWRSVWDVFVLGSCCAPLVWLALLRSCTHVSRVCCHG